MILQRLCELYDALAEDESVDIAPVNYSNVECSYCIELTRDGDVSSILPLGHEKEKVELHFVPEHKKRSSVLPYFLCDNPKNLLGYEYKKDPQTKQETFTKVQKWIDTSLSFHRRIIGDSSDEGLHAVLLFLEKRCAAVSPDLLASGDKYNEEIYKGKSLLFKLEGKSQYIHDRSAAKKVWETYCQKQEQSDDKTVLGQCLITGDQDVSIERIHNAVRIFGRDSKGCSLVSFKPDACHSYGKKHSYNAPVSKIAAFKYITALKYLLDNPKMNTRLGETTVVFWATKSPDAQDIMSCFFQSDPKEKPDPQTLEKIREILAQIREGKSFQDDTKSESVSTYILGLSPNAARASIRFWYATTFEAFMRCMARHQDEIGLQTRSGKVNPVSFYQILRNSVPLNVTEKKKEKGDQWWKKVPTSFENALFRAILLGGDYPVSLYVNILQRLRTEAGVDAERTEKPDKKKRSSKKEGETHSYKPMDGINYVRVGFVKAVLCRNYKREDVTMAINLKSTNKAYNMGRLFAVLEKLQEAANNDTTIRGKFFATASVNPKLVFPSLLNLAQHHIEKVDSEHNDLASKYYDADISTLLWSVDNEFPPVLNLEEQGLFILGYYHQREYYYLPKEEKEKLKMEA